MWDCVVRPWSCGDLGPWSVIVLIVSRDVSGSMLTVGYPLLQITKSTVRRQKLVGAGM